MKRLLKTIIIIIGVIVVLLIGAYLYIRFMPEKSVNNINPDYTLTVSSLASEYESAPDASDKKYIDRVVEVSGTISEITTDQNSSTVFILRNNENQTGVLCTLAESETQKAKHYKTGDQATIKGTCTGMLFEVVLNKCVIIK